MRIPMRKNEYPDRKESRTVRLLPFFLLICICVCCLFLSACGGLIGCSGTLNEIESLDLPEERTSSDLEPESGSENVIIDLVDQSEETDEFLWAVSDLATERFMQPIEQNSWERPEEEQGDIRFVMLHFSSAILEAPEDPFDLDRMVRVYNDTGASVHYVIDREGNIWCFVPEDRVAWHAGQGSWKGDPELENRMSFHSIGIELLAVGSEKDMEKYLNSEEYKKIPEKYIGYTDAQYEALKSLLADLCERYGFPADREHVIGHEEYATDRKRDPGELFDWTRVIP